MVAERVGRPVRESRISPHPRQQPVGRAAMQSPGGNRGPHVGEFDEEVMDEYDGYTGAARAPAGEPATPQRDTTSFEALGGVGQYDNGGQGKKESPTVRGPSARTSADESPVLSSASESGSTPSRPVTRSDLQRVKRRLVNMSEHLRDSLKTSKAELWEAIDDEVQERKQESPLFKKLLDDRVDTIAETVHTCIGGFRDEMLSLIEPLAHFTGTLQPWVQSVEAQLDEAKRKHDALEATVFQVTGSAQEAAAHLNELHQKSQSEWSDWSLADTDEYQDLKARIEALEAGDPSVPAFGAEIPAEDLFRNLAERVADLEAEGPRGSSGAGTGLQPKKNSKSVVESKVVANLGPLTGDKSKFRQWDIKMVNALAQVRKSAAGLSMP